MKADVTPAEILIENRLRNSNDPSETALLATDLIELLWTRAGPTERVKILKYAKLAAECFLRSKEVYRAVWVLLWLRENTSLWEESLVLEQMLSMVLARKSGVRKHNDEGLPLPTPFQEFSATISFDENRADEMVRDQLRNIPSTSSPLFSNLKVGEVARLLRVADCVRLQKGAQLYAEGDEAKGFYILCSGELELQSKKGESRIATPIEFLGDIALFAEIPHSATAVASSDARLIYFGIDKLGDPFRSIPRLKEELHDLFHRRLFLSVSHHSLIFRHFHEIELEKCWDIFVPIHVAKDQVLMEPRMSPERFFLILRGRLEVARPGVPVVTLGPGHFVGERGVVLNKNRNAMVKTISDCHLLECDRWSYEELRTQFPEAAAKIDSCRSEYDQYKFSAENFVID